SHLTRLIRPRNVSWVPSMSPSPWFPMSEPFAMRRVAGGRARAAERERRAAHGTTERPSQAWAGAFVNRRDMTRHRVLIVEDEQDIAGLIKHTLERSGQAEAEIVQSGDAALKVVADRPPDLIILDLNLPVLSGVEVCRILRSRPDGRHVPIIMLTART